MTCRQRVLMRRQAIAGCLALTLLASCTTVMPSTASHPGKPREAQDDDKYQCWVEARSLTGHDPEGSSAMGRLLGAAIGGAMAGARDAPVVAVAIHRPRPAEAAVKSLRKAYETCLTGRGYSMAGAR